MVPRLWLVALVGLVACREPASDEGSPRVASLVPPRQPAPSPAPAAPSLLPKAPRPVTLQHAHVLAGQEQWPESAAVYSALVEADAADARALAGRGYALSSWGDPRVIVQALDDLEQARTMTEDARLSSAIAFNLGNLHERLGHPHRAREQYEQALRLQSDGAPSSTPSTASTRARSTPTKVRPAPSAIRSPRRRRPTGPTPSRRSAHCRSSPR